MKRLIPLFFAAMFFMAACNKIEIIPPEQPPLLDAKQVQWGLVINYTATWCGACGSSGVTALRNTVAISDNIVAVTNHASNDPMYNAALFNSMGNDRPTGGTIPAFWVGDNKAGSTWVVSEMNTLLNQTPIAGIDMRTYRVGNVFNIAVQVKFFTAGTGDYFLSFWMLESEIDGSPTSGSYNQAGNSESDYKHNYVLRAAYDNKVYGEKILTNPAIGSVHEEVLSMEVNPAWTNDVYIAACLWKYDASGNPSEFTPRYKYINGFVFRR